MVIGELVELVIGELVEWLLVNWLNGYWLNGDSELMLRRYFL
jgi:hypothetical protein